MTEWHLTKLINYPDDTEVETTETFKGKYEMWTSMARLIDRIDDGKISSLVLTITSTVKA